MISLRTVLMAHFGEPILTCGRKSNIEYLADLIVNIKRHGGWEMFCIQNLLRRGLR